MVTCPSTIGMRTSQAGPGQNSVELASPEPGIGRCEFKVSYSDRTTVHLIIVRYRCIIVY